MRYQYHPEFSSDILRFTGQYGEISAKLQARFRSEIDEALMRIKSGPTNAGHFVNTGSQIVPDIRRRDLVSFPYFVLYGIHGDLLVFGSIIPSASDPLTWLARFSNPA